MTYFNEEDVIDEEIDSEDENNMNSSEDTEEENEIALEDDE